MGNVFAVYQAVLHGVMRLAGMSPRRVEIEPGTILNFWAPNETPNKPESGDGVKNKLRKPKLAVVFLHGFEAGGILTWQFQVLALARKYRVYVPDLLFFGGSTTDKSDRSPASQAECVAKGLRKLGVERCTLVGFAYGGTVGFKMAELYPNLVDSMVVTASVTAFTKSTTSAILERVGRKSLPEFLLPVSVKGVEYLLGFATYRRFQMPSFIYKQFLEAMFNNRKEQEELLNAMVIDDKDFTPTHYPQRVHLLWGENDRIFTMEVANDLKRQLGDRTTLQYIEKAGHVVQIERSCTYNKRLKEILATLMEDGQKE